MNINNNDNSIPYAVRFWMNDPLTYIRAKRFAIAYAAAEAADAAGDYAAADAARAEAMRERASFHGDYHSVDQQTAYDNVCALLAGGLLKVGK